MVDILVVDVRLDMDEMTTIGLSVIGTLAVSSYPTRSWSWMRMCVEFRDEILFKEGTM